MADPTVPVRMTRDEQRRYLILSLKLLKDGAGKQQQTVTKDMLTGSVTPDAGLTTATNTRLADYTRTNPPRKRDSRLDIDGDYYSTGYDLGDYDEKGTTNGYTKAQLDQLSSALDRGDVAALRALNIDVTQLMNGEQLDPNKVQVLKETLTVLSADFDQAKSITADSGTVACRVNGQVTNDESGGRPYNISGTTVPGLGTAQFNNSKFLTGNDINGLLALVESRPTVGELVDQPPTQTPVSFLGARFARRLASAPVGDGSQASPSNGEMITRFSNQRDVDAQLTRFIDTLIVGIETKGALTEDKLKQLASVFDSATKEADLQKLSTDLGIPVDTMKQWRGDPEVKQLGQGFALCLKDHHQSGNLTALFPDAGNKATISSKDLLALKAGFLDTTPPVLDADPELDDKEAAAADLAYRGRIKTTVADFRKQIVKQGYVRSNLVDTQIYASPYAGAGGTTYTAASTYSNYSGGGYSGSYGGSFGKADLYGGGYGGGGYYGGSLSFNQYYGDGYGGSYGMYGSGYGNYGGGSLFASGGFDYGLMAKYS